MQQTDVSCATTVADADSPEEKGPDTHTPSTENAHTRIPETVGPDAVDKLNIRKAEVDKQEEEQVARVAIRKHGSERICERCKEKSDQQHIQTCQY
jgi:hypothetical protein